MFGYDACSLKSVPFADMVCAAGVLCDRLWLFDRFIEGELMDCSNRESDNVFRCLGKSPRSLNKDDLRLEEPIGLRGTLKAEGVLEYRRE